ncbi:MAG: patatin-like phospholipase family protein [Hellea sp.]
MSMRLFFSCLLALFLYPINAFSCDFNDSDGLDVGLVLSGGGAKASTQVGVIKVLDELGIPVHCVTGTSMGAVVGSFYAAGYSGDEIGDILTDNDWGETFRGASPRRDKSFIEKEREETYFSGNIAGLDKTGLKLPGGINSMQGLKSLYRNILSDVPQEIDFDDLELPFRAIAADLQTGETMAFEQGDLVEAILASMAVPGVFSPREVDGRFYVDGGIASTLPVKIAQDMGADIIIALDVSNAPSKPSADISIASTAQQITTIVVWRSLQRDLSHLKKDDLLIHPNPINIGTAAYTRADEGLVTGYEVGLKHRAELLAIKALAAPSKRNVMPFTKPPTAAVTKIVNTSPLDDDLIKNRYQQGKSHTEDPKIQARRLRDLASFGGFGEVDLGHSNGETLLTAKENRLGRNLLQIGINATNDFDGNSSYSALARLTRKPLSSRGGDISLSAELGTNLGLSAELYQPIGSDGRFFIQPELFARWDQNKFVVLDERIGDFWVRQLGVRARLGREIGKWGVFALETEIAEAKTNDIVSIIENFPTIRTQTARVGLYFSGDTLDRNDWPTSGQRIRLRARRAYELNEEKQNSDRFEASWLAAFEVSDFGVLLNGRYGRIKDNKPNLASADLFQLGGFRQLASFGDNSIPLSEFTFGSVEVFKRLNAVGNIFEVPLYAGAIGEAAYFPLDFFGSSDSVGTISGSLYLGADTPLGPVFLGSAYGNNDKLKVFFKFGRTF